MKIAYFDCFAGISGDMLLGALVDAGVSWTFLKEQLALLNIDGFSVNLEETTRNGLRGKKVTVKSLNEQPCRTLNDIVTILKNTSLEPRITNKAIQVFRTLAKAEAQIHNKTINEIHFHEVGAIDAIVDIVGSIVGIDALGIDKIYASALNTGRGFIKCEHGTIPCPAPATLEILKGVPVYSSGIESELVTPTGAAIIKTLADSFGSVPGMTVIKTGYGAGSRELAIPNLLRLIVGESDEQSNQEQIVVLESTIDDSSPELIAYTKECLLKAGALDCYSTPAFMKKNRPGFSLTVLSKNSDVDKLLAIIFRETNTLGVRINKQYRALLKRELISVDSKYGPVKVKLAYHNNKLVNIAPEYEDCKRLALEHQQPLKLIYQLAESAAIELLRRRSDTH